MGELTISHEKLSEMVQTVQVQKEGAPELFLSHTKPPLGRQDMREGFQELMQAMREATTSLEAAEAKIADQAQQLELLRSLAAKNDPGATTRLAQEVMQLRAQLTQANADLLEFRRLAAIRHVNLTQANTEIQLGAERVRRNVAAALETAQSRFREEQNEMQSALQAATAEVQSLRVAIAAKDEEAQRVRAQHEEQLTRLTQRRAAGTEAALRQRIAELEESLSARDEASFARPPPAATGGGKKTNLAKKFKIDN
jgi:chromosome segregation ATPase